MYTVVSLTKNECSSGGNCSYIVRLSVCDLHGPTKSVSTFLFEYSVQMCAETGCLGEEIVQGILWEADIKEKSR